MPACCERIPTQCAKPLRAYGTDRRVISASSSVNAGSKEGAVAGSAG